MSDHSPPNPSPKPPYLYAAERSYTLSTPQDFLDLFGEAMGEGVSVIAIPVDAIDESFFQLRTRLAGEVAQKAANYHFILAIVGNIERFIHASDAFRDLVVESERTGNLIFAPTIAELETKLIARSHPRT